MAFAHNVLRYFVESAKISYTCGECTRVRRIELSLNVSRPSAAVLTNINPIKRRPCLLHILHLSVADIFSTLSSVFDRSTFPPANLLCGVYS